MDRFSNHMSAARFRGLRPARILARTVPVATGWRARLLGLAWLDRELAGAGLLIPRCRSVHTFGMRFDIHLVFLDADGDVVGECPRVGANRMRWCRKAAAVLEIPVTTGERSL